MAGKPLQQRLDEWAETHGSVLLGMHKDLSTLRDRVDKLGRHGRAGAPAESEQSNAELLEAQAKAVHDIEKLVRAERDALQNARAESQRLDAELLEAHTKATHYVENLIRSERDAVQKTRAELALNQNTIQEARAELALNQKTILSYMANQQRVLDEHARDVQRQEQSVAAVLAEIQRKMADYQRKTDQFNKITRRLAIVALVLLSSLAIWAGINQWIH